MADKTLNGEFTKMRRVVLAQETQRCIDANRVRIIRATEKKLLEMGYPVDLDAAEIAMNVAKANQESNEPKL